MDNFLFIFFILFSICFASTISSNSHTIVTSQGPLFFVALVVPLLCSISLKAVSEVDPKYGLLQFTLSKMYKYPFMWAKEESNLRPPHYQCGALTI